MVRSGERRDLVITFDLRVLSTKDQRVWTAFCKIFSRTPHLTIFGAPKYAPWYAYLTFIATSRLNSPNLSPTLFLALQMLEQCLQQKSGKSVNSVSSLYISLITFCLRWRWWNCKIGSRLWSRRALLCEDSADVTFLVWWQTIFNEIFKKMSHFLISASLWMSHQNDYKMICKFGGLNL